MHNQPSMRGERAHHPRARRRVMSPLGAAMAEHRLPGMSIDVAQWTALGRKAGQLGITRTEAIRLAIDLLVNHDDPSLLQGQQAQRQLDAIRALLGPRSGGVTWPSRGCHDRRQDLSVA